MSFKGRKEREEIRRVKHNLPEETKQEEGEREKIFHEEGRELHQNKKQLRQILRAGQKRIEVPRVTKLKKEKEGENK